MMSNYNQVHRYSVWEEDNYEQALEEDNYQGFSEPTLLSTNLIDHNIKTSSFIPYETTLSTNANVAGGCNTNMVEIANLGSGNLTMNPVMTTTSSPGPGKPKKRRSKGTQSQATTYLNASIKDFRALVQQHTGCHVSSTSAQRGPITLCFESCSSNNNEASLRTPPHFSSS